MLPVIVEELRGDLMDYGRCVYSIRDDGFEFAIRRYDPEEVFYTLERN